MKAVIVLAMHGVPPSDLGRGDLAEYFRLHMELRTPGVGGTNREAMEERCAELEARIRAWPRSRENDPFYHASLELADAISRATRCQVVVGFNEFCNPNLDEALDWAASTGAGRVIVVTPMMTKGGEHAEIEIPAVIDRARKRHPSTRFVYAWPFEQSAVAGFLAAQIGRFL